MNKNTNAPNQTTLILRLLCGGYLLYTAWGLREAFHENPLFIVAAVVFAVVGAVLTGVSLYWLIKTGGLMATPSAAIEDEPAEEESKDCEEEFDE